MTIGVRHGLRRLFGVAAVLVCHISWAQADPDVLEAIRARGHLKCGVGIGSKAYASVDDHGAWSGISVDFCRGLAAAVLGNKNAVEFLPLAATNTFSALRSGQIDVLSSNIGMTSNLDTSFGIRFVGVLVYEGQGFMVRRSQNITSALELSGARICAAADATDEQTIADYFVGLKMPFDLVKVDRWPDAVTAYTSKGCQVLAADLSALALARQGLADADEHVILPEMASKRPVGPIVRQGDEAWFSVVRWTLYALIAAEELGITAANVEAARASGSPEARRFLGVDKKLGKQLGLDPDWTQRVIRQVGNYGELFERHLGQKSPLKLERRLNNLATKGGVHYAPSFR
jgi:general L-amino acid transport system substrate-binding protein